VGAHRVDRERRLHAGREDGLLVAAVARVLEDAPVARQELSRRAAKLSDFSAGEQAPVAARPHENLYGRLFRLLAALSVRATDGDLGAERRRGGELERNGLRGRSHPRPQRAVELQLEVERAPSRGGAVGEGARGLAGEERLAHRRRARQIDGDDPGVDAGAEDRNAARAREGEGAVGLDAQRDVEGLVGRARVVGHRGDDVEAFSCRRRRVTERAAQGDRERARAEQPPQVVALEGAEPMAVGRVVHGIHGLHGHPTVSVMGPDDASPARTTLATQSFSVVSAASLAASGVITRSSMSRLSGRAPRVGW